jgi:hypothetical protein
MALCELTWEIFIVRVHIYNKFEKASVLNTKNPGVYPFIEFFRIKNVPVHEFVMVFVE